MPVILPPGLLRLVTKLSLHRVGAHAEHDRNRAGRGLGSKRSRGGNRDDHGNLAADEVDCQPRKAVVLVLRSAIFDRHVLSLDIADFRETAPDGVHAASISFGRSWGKESDHRHRRLLRVRRERPCRRAGDGLLDIVGAVADPQSDASKFEGNA
jgi:hypothetical protein